MVQQGRIECQEASSEIMIFLFFLLFLLLLIFSFVNLTHIIAYTIGVLFWFLQDSPIFTTTYLGKKLSG